VRLARTDEPELDTHPLAGSGPADDGRHRERGATAWHRDVHHELDAERQRPRRLHVHAAERDILASTGDPFSRTLHAELDRAIEWGARMAAKLDHRLMIALKGWLIFLVEASSEMPFG
jgi:hypothetical protein